MTLHHLFAATPDEDDANMAIGEGLSAAGGRLTRVNPSAMLPATPPPGPAGRPAGFGQSVAVAVAHRLLNQQQCDLALQRQPEADAPVGRPGRCPGSHARLPRREGQGPRRRRIPTPNPVPPILGVVQQLGTKARARERLSWSEVIVVWSPRWTAFGVAEPDDVVSRGRGEAEMRPCRHTKDFDASGAALAGR